MYVSLNYPTFRFVIFKKKITISNEFRTVTTAFIKPQSVVQIKYTTNQLYK